MKYTNILSFNTRTFALFAALLIFRMPWLYFAFELTVFQHSPYIYGGAPRTHLPTFHTSTRKAMNRFLDGIKGIIFDYGGTIDTGGDHWSEVIWRAYQEEGVPISKNSYATLMSLLNVRTRREHVIYCLTTISAT